MTKLRNIIVSAVESYGEMIVASYGEEGTGFCWF